MMNDHWQSTLLLNQNSRMNQRHYLQKQCGIHAQNLLLMQFILRNLCLTHQMVFSNQFISNRKCQNF